MHAKKGLGGAVRTWQPWYAEELVIRHKQSKAWQQRRRGQQGQIGSQQLWSWCSDLEVCEEPYAEDGYQPKQREGGCSREALMNRPARGCMASTAGAMLCPTTAVLAHHSPQVCVFTAPLFSAFCALACFGLVREVGAAGAALAGTLGGHVFEVVMMAWHMVHGTRHRGTAMALNEVNQGWPGPKSQVP